MMFKSYEVSGEAYRWDWAEPEEGHPTKASMGLGMASTSPVLCGEVSENNSATQSKQLVEILRKIIIIMKVSVLQSKATFSLKLSVSIHD